MHNAVILLGGNQGNVISSFKDCIQAFVAKGYALNKTSQIYTSKAWGYESDHLFYNQLLVVDTNNSPQQILSDLMQIENELGRVRPDSNGYTDRTIDIDILFYDSAIIEEPNLIIPHPRLHLRKFCLMPLMEVMPEFMHPVSKRSISELVIDCKDDSIVKPL